MIEIVRTQTLIFALRLFLCHIQAYFLLQLLCALRQQASFDLADFYRTPQRLHFLGDKKSENFVNKIFEQGFAPVIK